MSAADLQWSDISAENCSIQRTLDLIGEKWTIQLIRDAANGVHRFDAFRRHIGLSEAVLADRLRTLVAGGIFETREYREPGRRARQEYRLTPRGWELLPVLVALMQWGDDHLSDGQGGPMDLRHRACGHPVRAVVQCTQDHESLGKGDLVALPGPSARPLVP